jgi:hypothetical protein
VRVKCLELVFQLGVIKMVDSTRLFHSLKSRSIETRQSAIEKLIEHVIYN